MYLLFDIGGTNMRFAVSNGKRLDQIRMFQAPKNMDEAIALFKKVIAGLPQGKISGMAGGVPRFERTKLMFWHTEPTEEILRRLSKSKVRIVNDAQIAGLGEAHYGAGKGSKILAYLTFSTGFGGSRIVDGRIDANYFGFEPRLQIAQFDPKKKTTPQITDFVSGRGLEARYKQRPERLKSKAAWIATEKWISVAATNAAVFWSPDTIVIGGGIGLSKHVNAGRIESYIKRWFNGMPAYPKVKKSSLGQLNGLYGAMNLAIEK